MLSSDSCCLLMARVSCDKKLLKLRWKKNTSLKLTIVDNISCAVYSFEKSLLMVKKI